MTLQYLIGVLCTFFTLIQKQPIFKKASNSLDNQRLCQKQFKENILKELKCQKHNQVWHHQNFNKQKNCQTLKEYHFVETIRFLIRVWNV